MIDWIIEAREYANFLDDVECPKNLTQKTARQFVKEELENIIAINGESELYECEKRLFNLLHLKSQEE